MRLIINEVEAHRRYRMLLPVMALPLMVVPLWKCHTMFDRLFCGWGGFWVYSGSHHFALLCNNRRIVCVKDKDYC